MPINHKHICITRYTLLLPMYYTILISSVRIRLRKISGECVSFFFARNKVITFIIHRCIQFFVDTLQYYKCECLLLGTIHNIYYILCCPRALYMYSIVYLYTCFVQSILDRL